MVLTTLQTKSKHQKKSDPFPHRGSRQDRGQVTALRGPKVLPSCYLSLFNTKLPEYACDRNYKARIVNLPLRCPDGWHRVRMGTKCSTLPHALSLHCNPSG